MLRAFLFEKKPAEQLLEYQNFLLIHKFIDWLIFSALHGPKPGNRTYLWACVSFAHVSGHPPIQTDFFVTGQSQTFI